MSCPNVKECVCPNKTCQHNGKCCECISFHLREGEKDYLPYCLFPDNGGDKSMANLYRKLKARFEK